MKKSFKKLPLFFFPVYLLPVISFCQTESNNISVYQKTEVYEFVKGNTDNPVMVKEKVSTTYKCNGFRTSIPFVEFYDDRSSIDEVKIFVDGNKAKNIIPSYNYYSVDDIFYSDARICYFQLPLEKKNSVSEVDIEKTILDPRYFNNVFFDEFYNLENKQVIIKVPNWMQLEIKEYNFSSSGISKTIQQKDNATVYIYSIQNLAARKQYTNAPGPTYLYPHILFIYQSAQPDGLPSVTYFKNLQQQYNWYRSLVIDIGNDPAIFKDKVNEIIKDKKTDVEKIQAVYNWVQANIRYIAFEDGIAGFKPEKAQEVFSRKYGDCKGMANLTKEMLKAAGYDARLCWLGTNHIVYDYSTPSLAVDNHMICALKLNGKFIYLDATEKYIGYGEYAQRIQGRQVLIEDGNQYILDRVPVKDNMQNIQTQKEELKIENGALAGKVELNYKGESKENMLVQFYSITKQNRDIALQQFLSGNNNNYKIQKLSTSGLDDWNRDLYVQYDLQFVNAVTEFSDEKYIDMDFDKDFSKFIIDTSRSQDYWMYYKYNISNETELELPDGYQAAELPAPLVIKNNNYSFNLQYSLSGNKLIYKKQLQVFKPIITVQQFSNWNADIAKLNNFYNEQITLKKQ